MSTSLRIVGLAGSIRTGSYSQILLNAFAAHLPAETIYEALDIGAYPHYNEDLEKSALPDIVVRGRAAVAQCDGVILVTPEFNHGLPGVLKNTLDWLSRPAFKSAFRGKPVMFATQSPSPLGGVRAFAPLRETMASMLCRIVPLQELAVAGVADKIADGRVTDAKTLERIHRLVEEFLAAI